MQPLSERGQCCDIYLGTLSWVGDSWTVSLVPRAMPSSQHTYQQQSSPVGGLLHMFLSCTTPLTLAPSCHPLLNQEPCITALCQTATTDVLLMRTTISRPKLNLTQTPQLTGQRRRAGQCPERRQQLQDSMDRLAWWVRDRPLHRTCGLHVYIPLI